MTATKVADEKKQKRIGKKAYVSEAGLEDTFDASPKGEFVPTE